MNVSVRVQYQSNRHARIGATLVLASYLIGCTVFVHRRPSDDRHVRGQ
jgi:hypothetical protein